MWPSRAIKYNTFLFYTVLDSLKKNDNVHRHIISVSKRFEMLLHVQKNVIY